jgi:Family of unknown function (DUF6498)
MNQTVTAKRHRAWMADVSALTATTSRWTLRNLLHPATLLLLASNAVPVVGLLAWHWDAFLLLLSYWLETAVIAFWTLVQIAVCPRLALGGSGPQPGPIRRAFILMQVALFTGFFMAVHFSIIWEAFGGRPGLLTTASEFFATILWQSGLWIAALAAFVSRGVTALRELIDPVRVRRWVLAIWPQYPGRLPGDPHLEPGAAMIRLGGRIILMQVAVLVGGFIAVKIGMAAPVILPLMILIGIKTYIDLSLHLADLPGPEK